MRYLIIALFFLPLLATALHAQTDVPSAVTAAFKAKFPGAEKPSWDKEDAGTYEAEFSLNGHKMSALFDRSGSWKETETRIEVKDLPSAVARKISKKFSGYDVEDAERIEDAKGHTSYEVGLEKGNTNLEVVFSADGQVLKQKAEKENDQNERDED